MGKTYDGCPDCQYLLFIQCSLKNFEGEIVFAKRRDFYILKAFLW